MERLRRLRFPTSIVLLLSSAMLTACASPAQPPPVAGLALTSPDFRNGAVMPKRTTCDGAGASPALEWQAVPSRTASVAVIAEDLDSPLPFLFGHFVHWVVYDWPANERRVANDAPRSKKLRNGAKQGTNGFGRIGYGGPCPPGGSTHRYGFTVYALDARPAVPAGASAKGLERAMAGHIIASGELRGRYH